MVYYTKESESGCLITDSVVVEVSSNPSTAFHLINNSSVCSPENLILYYLNQH